MKNDADRAMQGHESNATGSIHKKQPDMNENKAAVEFFDTMTENVFKEYNTTGIIVGKIIHLGTTPGNEDSATICETNTPLKDFDGPFDKTLRMMAKTKAIIEEFFVQVREDGHEIIATIFFEAFKFDGKVKLIVKRITKDFEDTREYEVKGSRATLVDGATVSEMDMYDFVETVETEENEK